MALRLLKTIPKVQRSPVINLIPARLSHEISVHEWEQSLIGNREIVGPGINNQPSYFDRMDFPCPAIRFKSNDAPGVQALREKEKGDWHKLTRDEKKALYRASFCQTLEEVQAPTGHWKQSLGCVFFTGGLVLCIFMAVKIWVQDPLPDSLSLENRQKQLMRILDLEMENIEGISSRYDYEKGDWKK